MHICCGEKHGLTIEMTKEQESKVQAVIFAKKSTANYLLDIITRSYKLSYRIIKILLKQVRQFNTFDKILVVVFLQLLFCLVSKLR